jgi:anaerobic magnesium-protoporphyrin IX monomethyl ester cyclase
MNSFPPALYQLLDVECYFRHKGARQIDYSSSRGCPYRCTFCADPIIYKSKWTGLKPERILRELLDLHHRYEMEEVFFLDDDLFASLKRIQALADTFIQAGSPFGWKGTARADELCRLPVTFFHRLRESGCRRINIGAESGSQQILDRIKKEYRAEEIVTAGRRAADAGIGVTYSFIAGFPGETDEDFQRTVEMIKELRRISPQLEATLYFYSPYPGTELVAELEARGSTTPRRLEEWADFSIDSAWLPDRERLSRKVRNLNFYLRHGYARRDGGPFRRMLQAVSRVRCDHDWYRLPLEPYLAHLLR